MLEYETAESALFPANLCHVCDKNLAFLSERAAFERAFYEDT